MAKTIRIRRGGATATVMASAGAMLAAAFGPSPAAAQDHDWKLSNGLPEGRQESAYLEAFAEDVAARTDGAVEITVYHGGSLGLEDADVLRWLPTGTAELGLIWAGYLGRDAPALNAVYIQGSVGTEEEHAAALPVLQDIYREALAESDIETVAFMNLPMLAVSVFCADEPVNSLEDLRDKKLRVWTRDQVETFERLGVAAQIVAQTEMYVALQTGVVDCALYPARYAQSVSLQEVTDHAAYLYPVAALPYVVGAAEDVWAELSPELQAEVTAAGEALWQTSVEGDTGAEAEREARAALEEAGVTWHDDFSAEDRRAFLDAAAETWAAIAEEAGPPAPSYRERVLSAIGRE
ncbi:MAG: TRAP transporter substrate-binding protein DctP [Azospirillaceae bacterium]